MFGQPHDACFESVAAIQLARHCIILGAGHVAEHVPIPFDAHGSSIMRIAGFAHQRQCVAALQLIPQPLAFVKLETGDRRTLHENARRRLRRYPRGASACGNQDQKPRGFVHRHQNGCSSTNRMIATNTSTGSSFSQRKYT